MMDLVLWLGAVLCSYLHDLVGGAYISADAMMADNAAAAEKGTKDQIFTPALYPYTSGAISGDAASGISWTTPRSAHQAQR